MILRSETCGDECLHLRMVDAQGREAVERDVRDEGVERLLERVERTPMIEMLGVDVGDDRDGRGQAVEAAVALVGLDHDPVAAPRRALVP